MEQRQGLQEMQVVRANWRFIDFDGNGGSVENCEVLEVVAEA